MLRCLAKGQRMHEKLAWLRMDLSKTQRCYILATSRSSRRPFILLGLIVGLFIYVFFTSDFATTSVTPARMLTSHLSSTTTSINQLFIQLLFKSTDTPSAIHQKNHAPSSHQHAYMPFVKKSVVSSHDTDHNIYTELESVTQEALHLQDVVDAGVDSPENAREQADEIVRHVQMDFSATNTLISSDLTSASSSSSNFSGPQCDISTGKWVEDDTYPLYDVSSCPFVDEGFSCQQNGRPDTKYTKWRWAPQDCKVPRFNGTDMLERLRGKGMLFVGDSLSRNQWESMLCMLGKSIANKSRIVQVQGHHISKRPGGYGFKFLDYDCQVELYMSPYLVERQVVSNQIGYILKLDTMDKLERKWRKADVLVFNTGHWWTSGKVGNGENCFQEGNEVHAKLDIMVAYKKALSTWAKWVDTYINPQNTMVFFQGYSPAHYQGGQWNSGGKCSNETEPIYKESFLTPYPDKMQALEGVVQGMRVPVHVLNITRLSDYRKDAHPSTFGHPVDRTYSLQDCSHWCLPGLPDTWNELLSFALSTPSV